MGEPEGERVAGDAPGALDAGCVDGGVGQPDERRVRGVARERGGDAPGAPGGAEAGLRGEHSSELGHGEERHVVRGGVVEAALFLGAAHGVGERAAAGGDDEAGQAREFVQQARQLRGGGEAAAELDDGGRRQASHSAASRATATAGAQRADQARASAVAGHILSLIERRVFWLGRLLFINKDRLAHAFIRTNNALVRLAPHGLSPDGVLILLPRCLAKEQLEKAKAMASARGVETAIVAGGEQARQRIREKRPSVVIGVACERDLLSGIRDVRHRFAVLGIANTRPDGPCRNTLINLKELEAALDLCIRPSASDAKSATAQA